MNARDVSLVLVSMRDLTNVERRVLALRFGLNGHKPTALTDVAWFMGTRAARVRAMEADALRKLAAATEKRMEAGP